MNKENKENKEDCKEKIAKKVNIQI